MMIRRAALVGLFAAAMTSCGSGGSSSTTGTSSRPDSYDVAAARACHALDVFVKDAKQHQLRVSDSQAFAKAQKKLRASARRQSKWAELSTDITSFVTDANNGDYKTAVQDGLAAGRECAKVSRSARIAGGFR
jgi:hypothetical protein